MKRRTQISGLILLLVLTVLFMISISMHRSREDSTVVPKPPEKSATQEQLRSLGYIANGVQEKQSAAAPASNYRKIIRSGEIAIQVQSVDSFLRLVDQHIQAGGGYVSSVETRDRWASMTIRVPPEALNNVVWWLREQGTVTSEKLQSEDISDQYYDLRARLENQKRFESRLLEMLKTNTGDLSDLIQVEDKLNSVREQIETMEGKLRMYDNLTTLVTLTLNVLPQSTQPPAHTFMQRLASAWQSSVKLLVVFVQYSGVTLVAALPWMALLLPFAFAARFVWRRNRRVVL